jgi:Flp pilus assembly protein TadD
MSLLLQALQKAAKNREGQAPAPEDELAAADAPLAVESTESDPEPEHGFDDKPAQELEELTIADEEELFGPDATIAAREPRLGLADDEALPPAAAPARTLSGAGARERSPSAQAATILRASESKGTGVIDWIKDRPVHAFAISGGIFGVFYGAYVYLQIFHPAVLRGDFMREPALQARTPPPPARPLSPPQPQPPVAVAQAPEPAPAAVVGPAGATSPAPAALPGTGMTAARVEAAPAKPASRGGTGNRDGGERMLEDETDGDLVAEAPRTAPPRRSPRKAQVEVDNVTFEDAVSVRSPEPRPVPNLGTLTRAWEALQSGRYQEAQTLYDEVASTEPDNVDAMLGLGALAGLRGNTEQALRLYGRALELEPRNAAAQAGIISIIGQADPQLSESRLKQLLAREPSGFLYFALGNLYAKQSLWASAQQAYYQAYQLQPDNPDYAYNLAVGLEHLGQSRIALIYYRRAIELRTLRGRAEFDPVRVEERIGQLAARVGNQ